MENLKGTNKISNWAFNIFRNFVFASLLASNLAIFGCGDKDWTIDPTPIEKKDTTPPKINIKKFGNVDVTWWKKITVSWNKIYIWDEILWNELVADINDEESGISKIEMYIETDEWKEKISSWYVVDKDCVLHIVCYNGNNLTANWSIPLTTNAPEVKVQNDTVNVFFWWKIEVLEKSLSIWWEEVARWDRWNLISIVFEEDGSGTKRDLKSWDNLNTSWTLWLTVKDKKETTIELHIDNRSIEWLDNLKNLDIKAGQTINLREYIKPAVWCEISDDAVLVSEKWESQAVKLSAFSVGESWNYTLIIKISDEVDTTKSKTVEINIKISAEDYKECDLSYVDFSSISWFNKLTTADKNFIGPVLRLSLISALHENKDRISIIAWENSSSSHAATAINYISNLTNSEVIWNEKLNWNNRTKGVLNYVDNHPDKMIFVSCAIESDDLEWLKKFFKELYKRPNVCVLTAIWNNSAKWDWVWVIPNEDVKLENKWGYRNSTSSNSSWYYEWNTNYKFWEYQKSSYNSGINNHYTITWWPSWKTSVYTYNTDYFWNNACLMPSWFPSKWKWNTVLHMRSLQSSDGASSFATAVGSATIWNAIDILRYYYPNITTIPEFVDIIDKYLEKNEFKYVDSADWSEKDWWFFYEFDWNKFMKNEILRINELKNIDTGSDVIDLPSYKGVCYTWKWVWFWIGKTYYWGLTKDNINYLLAAWEKGESVTWTDSKSMWDSQWWRGNVGVISVSKNWEKIYEMTVDLKNKSSSKVGKRKVPGNNKQSNNMWRNEKYHNKNLVKHHNNNAIQGFKNSRK